MKTTLLIAGLTLSALNSTAFAQSDHTRGGGEVVNRNGYRELRDLLEHSACDWHTGDEIMTANGEVSKILTAVAKIDWYFASMIEREVRRLDWCLTGKLVKVNTNDRDAIMTPVTQNTEQLAIRMLDSNDVYIDEELFNTLSPSSKAFLILHETIHSFISVNAEMRNEKLRSMVKALNRLNKGEINTRKSLALQISKNEIIFPNATNLLDPIKNYILYVLGSDAEKSTILQNTNVEDLTPSSSALKNALDGLTEQDRTAVINATEMNVIEDICNSSDQTLLNQIIPTLKAHALIACLNHLENDLSMRSKIIALPTFKNWIHDLLSTLSKKTVSKSGMLLQIPSEMAMMSTATSGNTATIPLTSLIGVSNYGWNQLNPQGQAFYLLVKTLIEKKDLTSLEKITQDPIFTEAFSFEKIKNQVDAITTDIPREKALAQAILKDLPQQFWSAFVQQLSTDLGSESAEQFKKQLDQAKLGIKI